MKEMIYDEREKMLNNAFLNLYKALLIVRKEDLEVYFGVLESIAASGLFFNKEQMKNAINYYADEYYSSEIYNDGAKKYLLQLFGCE